MKGHCDLEGQESASSAPHNKTKNPPCYARGCRTQGGVWVEGLTLWMAWSMTTMFCPDSICVNTFRPCSEHRTVRFVSKPRAKSGWALRAFFGFLSSA